MLDSRWLARAGHTVELVIWTWLVQLVVSTSGRSACLTASWAERTGFQVITDESCKSRDRNQGSLWQPSVCLKGGD